MPSKHDQLHMDKKDSQAAMWHHLFPHAHIVYNDVSFMRGFADAAIKHANQTEWEKENTAYHKMPEYHLGKVFVYGKIMENWARDAAILRDLIMEIMTTSHIDVEDDLTIIHDARNQRWEVYGELAFRR